MVPTVCVGFPLERFAALRESRWASALTERISKTLSPDAHDFVSSLLEFDPASRLGTVLGAQDVKAHPFFSGIDWDLMLSGHAEPPLPTLTQPHAQPAN